MLTAPRGVSALELAEAPEPEPGPGQALVRVRAAALNFADVLVCEGRYPAPPELPAVLGREVAGDVIRGGEGTPFRPGDAVFAITGGGGFAELAVVDAATTWALPAGMGYAEGAAFPLAFLSAYVPLTRQLRVGPGRTVLVHAAAGGVGSAAVQLAAHLGARVIATAGSDEKRRVAAELGAAATVDYTRDDFADAVREAAGGQGVDAVLDPVGGPIFEVSLTLLRPLGAIVAVGYAAGPWPPVDVRVLAGRNVGVHGFYLARVLKLLPDLVAEAMAELLALRAEGAVRPVIGAELPLEETRAAHELLARRGVIGKVVVVP